MSDTISRQAAIDALDKVAEMFPYRIPGNAKTYRQYNEAWSDAIDAAENALEALPSAQPGWIPCSERMPEEGEVVLTQAKFKDDMKMAVSSRIDYNYWTGWGTRDINIIAWMPLLTPWEGEQDERM